MSNYQQNSPLCARDRDGFGTTKGPAEDPRRHVDRLRAEGKIVCTHAHEWTVLGHAEVSEIAQDAQTFSSAVSRFLQIPNGLDGDEHQAWRMITDPFMSDSEVARLEPSVRGLAKQSVSELLLAGACDAMELFAMPFAVRAQVDWLGWDHALEGKLISWMRERYRALGSADSEAIARVAASFDAIVLDQIQHRRNYLAKHPDQVSNFSDITSQLMQTQFQGRALTDDELVSILRNWTAGDLGSIAACIGVILYALATDQLLQDELRAGVSDHELNQLIDEILRVDDPFLTSRRIATRDTTIAGKVIEQGDRLHLSWTSANRDAARFDRPTILNARANAGGNLVYGIGAHACPGRALATMRLRIVTQEILRATSSLSLDSKRAAQRSVHVIGGWSYLPVKVS